MNAKGICNRAAALVSGARAESHGDKRRNHHNIAVLWNAWHSIRRDPSVPLSAADCAVKMALLKIARRELGEYNPDDIVDAIGYLAIAGELDEEEDRARRDAITPIKMRGQV